jgi:hypothetical protein
MVGLYLRHAVVQSQSCGGENFLFFGTFWGAALLMDKQWEINPKERIRTYKNDNCMNKIQLTSKNFALGALCVIGHIGLCHAQGTLDANATLSGVQNGSIYDYTLTLNNPAGSSGIGDFWFDWTPGNFYLTTSPSSVTPAAGWSIVTQSGSIEFSTTTPLAPGSSATFLFTSTEAPGAVGTPNTVYGDSTQASDSSTVYTGSSAFSGSTQEFNVAPVPEPSTISLLVTGLGGALFACKRRFSA